MKVFEMTVGRIMDILIGSPLDTLYIFICTSILCVMFQVFILKKELNAHEYTLSRRHFICVYIFLLYLSFVFRVTGIGTVWMMGRYDTLIHINQISLMPFSALGTASIFSNLGTDVMNIIMTIPLGFLLPFIWKEFRSIKKIALVGFCFSFAIELTQLFNRRLTATDDLIMNTLGAVLGYIIFKAIYKIISKKRKVESKKILASPIIRNEAIIYMVCAFMGVFLFYNSFFTVHLDPSAEDGTPVNIEETDIEYIPTGTIAEISDDFIVVDRMELIDYKGKIVVSNTGEQEMLFMTENTVIEIWRTNTLSTLEPIVTVSSKDALNVHDTIDIQGMRKEGNLIAEKIIIWKFDR